jgi:tetratricopeptide (TPR) repeat protein/TolB-like protein
MSDPTKAVFLSYTREDLEAARRIADALRSQGVEVLFNQDAAPGGEDGEAKAGRQIRECALFMTVVSAQTQQQAEGNFRREWKLAAERSREMPSGAAYLVPVVIDDTPEVQAVAPEEFMKVQWTRLAGGLPTMDFVTQVKNLLSGGQRRRPTIAPMATGLTTAPMRTRPPMTALPPLAPKPPPPPVAIEVPPRKKSGRKAWIWIMLVLLVAAGAGAYSCWCKRSHGREPPEPGPLSRPAPFPDYLLHAETTSSPVLPVCLRRAVRPGGGCRLCPPMSDPGKAVFLSYASQDAEAAKRIAEALRAAGVEVWFDQSELRGGDAWDGLIRKRIKECVLFVPLITPTTNARAEGYFRLEWKLAVDRSHLMAEDAPFLFPIVIGEVTDVTARVPDKFREVQWTRLRLDETPQELATRVARLLSREPGAGSTETIRTSPGRERPGRWSWWMIFPIIGTTMGLLFAAVPMWKAIKGSPPRQSAPTTPAAPAQVAAEPPKATAESAPVLDPRRVALARFENLTGDPALDNVARLLESEMTRGLGTLPTIRLLPIEASGRAVAREAARAAGAASVIVGTYLKQGDQIEVSAEIVLVTEGEVFGTVGPAAAPAASLRGPALAEFIDRLTTGAHNVAVTLQNPPSRIAAVTYNRPWPRWAVVARAQGIRAFGNNPDEITKAAQQYRDILAEAPEMLKTKHDLARLLLNSGQFDEAQRLFRELLGPDRSRLSEAEILAITYDDALLAGDPDRAMTAARGLLELRPVSDAISQVLSCFWAQNRPRAAFVEFDRWWKKYGAQVPEASRWGTELGLVSTEVLMHVQEGNPEQALAALQRGDEIAAGRPFPSGTWLRGAAYAALNREADLLRLITDAGNQSGGTRIEPLSLQWQAHLLALHHGRPEQAGRWLAAALKSWEDLPAARREEGQFQTLGIWLNEAAGRHAEAFQMLEKLTVRFPDLINVVGARAIMLTAMGRTEEAAPFVKRLEQWDSRNARGLPQYWRARLAARAGDKPRAVELLRQAVAGGLWLGGFQSPTFDYGRGEPEFAGLRGYEPYEQLIKPKG